MLFAVAATIKSISIPADSISDLNGRVLLNQKWNGNRCIVQLNDAFKSGTYILNIYEKAKLLYRATIALKTKN